MYGCRPQVCREFNCRWIIWEDMPDEMRPDRAHLYVTAGVDDVLKVMVDADHPTAWQEGIGKIIIDELIAGGHHLLVAVGHQLTFLPGKGRALPDKIVLDWML
jgi:hypothetical protein